MHLLFSLQGIFAEGHQLSPLTRFFEPDVYIVQLSDRFSNEFLPYLALLCQ
jgi:hypothetical protein